MSVVKLKIYRGKVVQDCDVYIGRQVARGGWNLPESKWANPFTIAKYGSAEKVVARYEDYLRKRPDLMASLGELRGKVLGCWCAPGPCHGDVLVRLAALPTLEDFATLSAAVRHTALVLFSYLEQAAEDEEERLVDALRRLASGSLDPYAPPAADVPLLASAFDFYIANKRKGFAALDAAKAEVMNDLLGPFEALRKYY
jgi:hypothetical protein